MLCLPLRSISAGAPAFGSNTRSAQICSQFVLFAARMAPNTMAEAGSGTEKLLQSTLQRFHGNPVAVKSFQGADSQTR